jgi:hypothetical protein
MANERSLTRDEIVAMKFAAHRQLARWSKKPQLSAHQHAQRDALKRAVRALEDRTFARGCELHPPSDEQHGDHA